MLSAICPCRFDLMFTQLKIILTLQFIHSLIIQIAYPLRVAGVLEPIPVVVGQKAGYTLNRLPVYHKAHLYR